MLDCDQRRIELSHNQQFFQMLNFLCLCVWNAVDSKAFSYLKIKIFFFAQEKMPIQLLLSQTGWSWRLRTPLWWNLLFKQSWGVFNRLGAVDSLIPSTPHHKVCPLLLLKPENTFWHVRHLPSDQTLRWSRSKGDRTGVSDERTGEKTMQFDTLPSCDLLLKNARQHSSRLRRAVLVNVSELDH